MRTGAFLVAALAALGAAAATDPVTAREADPVGLTVTIASDRGRVNVGEPMAVRIIITNREKAPVEVVDWEKNVQGLVTALRIEPVPGQPTRFPPAHRMPNLWAAPAKDWFRTLPPGETVLDRSIVPLVPGWATVTVTFSSTTELYRDPSGREQRVAGAWLGAVSGQARVEVSSEMPEAMKKQCEAIRRRATDPKLTDDDRIGAVAEAAAGKDYFAARCVQELYQALAPGPVKQAALAQLAALAKFGTAYDAMPLLVEAMGSGATPQAVRLDLVAWVEAVLAASGRADVGDQAVHVYPEPLRTQARDVLRRMVADPDAEVAARARQVVEGWEKDD